MKRLIFLLTVICVVYIFTGCPATPEDTPAVAPGYSSSSSYEKYENYMGTLWLIEEVADMGEIKINFKYDYDSSSIDTYVDVAVTPHPDDDSGKCRYTFNQTALSDATIDRTFVVADDLSGDITITIPSDGYKKTLKCKDLSTDGVTYLTDNFVYETYYNFNGKRLYERLYDGDGVLSQEKVDEYRADGTTYTKEIFFYRNQTESVYTIKDVVFPEYNAFDKCIRENRQVVRQTGGVIYDKYSYQFDWDPSRSFIVREAKYGYVSDSVNESEQISTWYNDTYDTINGKNLIVNSLHYSENKCDFYVNYTYDAEGNQLTEIKHSYYYNNKINDTAKVSMEKYWSRYYEGELFVVKEETRSYDLENQSDEPTASVSSQVRSVIDSKLRRIDVLRFGKNDKIFANEKSSFYKD